MMSYDPKDRTPNEPVVLVSPKEVLIYYNKTLVNHTGKVDYYVNQVTDDIKTRFETAMKDKGWQKVIFFGNQCLLRADVRLIAPDPLL